MENWGSESNTPSLQYSVSTPRDPPPYVGSDDWLSHGDFLAEVDILNGVQQIDALLQRSLERLASRDQAHPAGAFVDDGGRDSLFQIAFAFGFATAVDQ